MKTDEFLSQLVKQQKISPAQKFDLTSSQLDMFAYAEVQDYILCKSISVKEIGFFLEIAKHNENFFVWREPYITLVATQKITAQHIVEFKLLVRILRGDLEKQNLKFGYRSVYAWLDQSPCVANMLERDLLTPKLIKIIREQAYIIHMRLIEQCIFTVALKAHAQGVSHVGQALENLLSNKYFHFLLMQNRFGESITDYYFSSPLDRNIQQLIIRIVQSDVSTLDIFIASEWDTRRLLNDMPELTNIILFHLFSDRHRFYKSLLFISNKEEILTQIRTQTAVTVNQTIIDLFCQTITGNINLESKRIYDDLRIKMFSRYLVMGRHESGNVLYGLPLEVITMIAANAAHEQSLFSRDARTNIAHTYANYFDSKKGLKRAAAGNTDVCYDSASPSI